MSNFIKSSLALGTPGPIDLDKIVTFEKFDHHQTKEKDGKHQIIFLRNERAIGQREIYWKYSCECDRDSEYDKIVATKTVTL